MSTGGGRRAVLAALAANLGIAVSKFAAFAVTGSTSLLAEGVHSVADSGNQLLLLVGHSRADRPADRDHPFGYGRSRYFYAFVVAVVLFSLGSLFAIYEGIHKLRHPEPLDAPAVAFVVLAVAIGLEGFSFRTAIHEANTTRGGQSWVDVIRRAKAPELPVLLLEDSAALVGLMLALGGVVLTLVTGSGIWDGIASLAIGLLLGAVAGILAVETHSLLLGESAAPASVAAIERALLGDPQLVRIIHLRTLHLGPEELLVAAKCEFAAALDVPGLAAAIDRVEARVRAVEPLAKVMYIEPDIYRPPA